MPLAAGAAVDKTMENGATPLLMASHNGHTAAAKVLLAAGASVAKATESGDTPL